MGPGPIEQSPIDLPIYCYCYKSLSNKWGTAEYRPTCQQTFFPLQDGSGFTTEGTASLSQVKAVTAAPEKATAFPVAGTDMCGTPQTPPPAEH